MPRRRALLGLGLAAPLRLHGAAPAERLGVAGPWEIASLEPATSGYLFTRMQVTQTLVDCDDQGRLQPGVARHWQASPDGLDWRFELHTGARFHDGQPITADGVARGLQRAVQRPGPLSLAPWADIGTRGDALHIRLKAPFSPLPALLTHSSAMLLSPGSFDADGRIAQVLGSGPYRVTQLDAPRAFEVQATGVQAVRRAHYLSAARAETRALMAEAGQAHIAWGLDPASLQRLRRRPGLQVQTVTVPRVLLLKLDAAHPALADRRVRQALSLALDRDGIAAGLLRDPALAATQLFPPPLADWHQPDLPPLRHDAAAARALLAAAGWGPQRPLRLTLRTFPDRPELPVLAAAVQEQCRLVGVQLEVLIGNSGDVPLRHRDGSLQLALVARQLALVPDPLGVLLQDHGAHLQRPGARPGGDWGSMNWRHDDVDQALLTLPRIADEAARAPLRRQLARRLHDDLPVIPISWYRQNAAVSQRLRGFSIDPLERSYRLDALQWT